MDSIALQQSLRHLDTAYTNFFKRKDSGYPRFKSRKRGKQAYTTVNVNNNIRLEGGRIRCWRRPDGREKSFIRKRCSAAACRSRR